jgi:hypothetical protein
MQPGRQSYLITVINQSMSSVGPERGLIYHIRGEFSPKVVDLFTEIARMCPFHFINKMEF